ncbi:MAG TPA: NADH-quinone oxidoreductase subunit N [Gemmataceae bacterium]|nr:NADH-quinone oxidoreductase subunit N [Gemmataceae bacterium]
MFLTPNALQSLQSGLLQDFQAFLPELVLCGSIVLLLLLRLFRVLDGVHLGSLCLCLTVLALFFAWNQWTGKYGLLTPADYSPGTKARDLFTGLLVYDNLTIFLRLFLLGFAALLIWLSLLTGIPDREDSADFYCLLLGATLGMSIMASANHLLMVFIGVEMASLPSYALAGFLKGRRQSSEASLKYVVYGGGASGIMLYGISLLAGKFGTAYLPDLAAAYATSVAQTGPYDYVVLLGTLFLLMGVGFKLAAVPFHFWCPDVFEGAAAEVAGFLSVASKGAALALLARVALVLVGLGIDHKGIDPAAWASVVHYLAPVLAFFAALTATFGNLAAYLQTNLKRLLAYSTIAHAGYMMMGLATLNAKGVSAVLLYLVAYLFMNLGAFAIVAFLRNETGSEDLASFRGLVRRSPWMVITLAIFLLSLLGMPPLAGFAAKFQIFAVLYESGQAYSEAGSRSLGITMYALLVIGGLNTVLSLFYYIKVLKVMILEKPLDEVEGKEAVPLFEPAGYKLYAGLLAVMIFVIGIFWNSLSVASDRGTDHFQARTGSEAVAKRVGEEQP